MSSNKKLHSELEGLHFDILNDYIEKGTPPDDMEPEMQQYLLHLQFIQDRFHQAQSPQNIINSLLVFYPELNLKTAKSRFDDALRFFYLDDNTSKQAWRNVLFELAMKAIQLAVKTCKTPEIALKIVSEIKKAYEIKGLHLPDEASIPKGLLDEKVEIHSITPSDIGLPTADRRFLAQMIDDMPLQEAQKLKIKQDAGVVPREIFNPNE